MFRLALLFLPAVLLAGEVRYARLGETEGRPEIQLRASDSWQTALRNSPVLEGAWIRTSPGSRAEVELDEGSAFRLDADGLCEISDYTRLSTGQRITLLSLDRGVAYFTGASSGRDSLVLAVPGAQVTIRGGARVRLEAREASSQIAVIEGAVVFSSPTAELEIQEGSMVRLDPANTARFQLFREITALESDSWSESRDKALVSASTGHVAAPPFGLADLDAAGAWVETAGLGTVWKPKTTAGWAPFRNGKWAWYDGLGYTWISAEPWGWLPYHYGRWMLQETAGWVWAPGTDASFSPGDVYWLRGTKLAGWGPLAPGEEWQGTGRPQLFLNAHTSFGPFVPEALEIDPAGFAAPKEPLATARFTAALPSPALVAARLEAKRPVLRAGSTRIVPQLAGVTYGHGIPGGAGAAPQEAPVSVNTTVIQPPPQPPVVIVAPPPEPSEVYYPAPVYTGIVVVNPPDRGDRDHDRRRGRSDRHDERKPSGEEARPKPDPKPEPAKVQRSEQVREQRQQHRAPDPPPPAAKPDPAPAPQPVDRSTEAVGRSSGEGRRR
ncbi:MAG TPA: FecR family protein [Bryobacteraceae bacterium]|nr:FecR family protein [Bryobacteraceae bacterium]